MRDRCPARIVALIGLLATVAGRGEAEAQPWPAFMTIPIPATENGYSAFESTSLSTEAELVAFLRAVKAKGGWNRFAAFEKALTLARINWRTESLVLLRHTEYSGSVKVVARPPRLRGSTLTLHLERQEPELQTMDMAYYCYALIVAPAKIRVVELTAKGKPTISVKVRP